ncbi:MAG TPA: GNAT family N-acetyltransferase [Cellulomonas sp.]
MSSSSHPHPTADVSVRSAIAGDEAAIAAVQLGAWRAAYADSLGAGALDMVDEVAVVERWRAAISSPPGRTFHVLVAMAGPRLVGFVSVAPVPAPPNATDQTPGGILLALEVAPGEQRTGHGSRLLAAAVDTLRTDGADQVITWVADGDEARIRFLSTAGLSPDGAVRELASGPGPDGERSVLRERRWGASI